MTISLTIIIVGITCVVSYMSFNNRELFDKLQFNPYIINHTKQWYRFISHGLIHADYMHLGVNMFVLWMFGSSVEQGFKIYFGNLGSLYFLILYLGAIFTSVVPTYEKHKNDHWYNGVGASGGVSGIMFALILMAPLQKYSLMILPFFELPAFIWGAIYIAYSVYMGKRGGDNVNHDAHLYGGLFGLALTLILKPRFFSLFIEQVLQYFS